MRNGKLAVRQNPCLGSSEYIKCCCTCMASSQFEVLYAHVLVNGGLPEFLFSKVKLGPIIISPRSLTTNACFIKLVGGPHINSMKKLY